MCMIYNKDRRPYKVRLCCRTGRAGEMVLLSDLTRFAYLKPKCSGLRRAFCVAAETA